MVKNMRATMPIAPSIAFMMGPEGRLGEECTGGELQVEKWLKYTCIGNRTDLCCSCTSFQRQPLHRTHEQSWGKFKQSI